MIDITMTATRRPEILNKTLSSFREYLFGPRCDLRLIINIDPVGHEECTTEDVLRVCHYYMGDNVVYRAPEKPSFPQAFHWVWSMASNEFVFHLEEDWELLRPIDLSTMMYHVHMHFAHLRLSQWRSEKKLKNWKWFLEYDKDRRAFIIPEDVAGTIGFCGHPSLNSLHFVKTCVDHMDPNRNPEKQIKWRNKALWQQIGRMHFGVYQNPNEPAAVRDIGRKWMIKNGWAKAGNKEHFVTWEKK